MTQETFSGDLQLIRRMLYDMLSDDNVNVNSSLYGALRVAISVMGTVNLFKGEFGQV